VGECQLIDHLEKVSAGFLELLFLDLINLDMGGRSKACCWWAQVFRLRLVARRGLSVQYRICYCC